MSYPSYPLPPSTRLPVPTEEDNGTRDIAFVAGRLAAGEPFTVITLHRSSFQDALARIKAAGGTVPGYDNISMDEYGFNRQSRSDAYGFSLELARAWNVTPPPYATPPTPKYPRLFTNKRNPGVVWFQPSEGARLHIVNLDVLGKEVRYSVCNETDFDTPNDSCFTPWSK